MMINFRYLFALVLTLFLNFNSYSSGYLVQYCDVYPNEPTCIHPDPVFPETYPHQDEYNPSQFYGRYTDPSSIACSPEDLAAGTCVSSIVSCHSSFVPGCVYPDDLSDYYGLDSETLDDIYDNVDFSGLSNINQDIFGEPGYYTGNGTWVSQSWSGWDGFIDHDFWTGQDSNHDDEFDAFVEGWELNTGGGGLGICQTNPDYCNAKSASTASIDARAFSDLAGFWASLSEQFAHNSEAFSIMSEGYFDTAKIHADTASIHADTASTHADTASIYSDEAETSAGLLSNVVEIASGDAYLAELARISAEGYSVDLKALLAQSVLDQLSLVEIMTATSTLLFEAKDDVDKVKHHVFEVKDDVDVKALEVYLVSEETLAAMGVNLESTTTASTTAQSDITGKVSEVSSAVSVAQIDITGKVGEFSTVVNTAQLDITGKVGELSSNVESAITQIDGELLGYLNDITDYSNSLDRAVLNLAGITDIVATSKNEAMFAIESHVQEILNTNIDDLLDGSMMVASLEANTVSVDVNTNALGTNTTAINSNTASSDTNTNALDNNTTATDTNTNALQDLSNSLTNGVNDPNGLLGVSLGELKGAVEANTTALNNGGDIGVSDTEGWQGSPNADTTGLNGIVEGVNASLADEQDPESGFKDDFTIQRLTELGGQGSTYGHNGKFAGTGGICPFDTFTIAMLNISVDTSFLCVYMRAIINLGFAIVIIFLLLFGFRWILK